MTKKRQKRYDEIRSQIKDYGIEIWGYLILDVVLMDDFSYNTTKILKNTIKNTSIKLRESNNGVEYLIVAKNE